MTMDKASKITVAALELDIRWADKTYNLDAVGRMLAALDGKCDIVILPEMFATGFTFDSGLAEDWCGQIGDSIRCFAQKHRMALSGTYLANDKNILCNRAFFQTPDGKCYHYDKRHLFSLGGEDKYLKAGESRCVFNYLGWNISMFVCYDLRFPKWMRNEGNAYDLALLPANWPARRDYAWRHLQIARAIENEAYLVSCNRRGLDASGVEHIGNSMALDYAGKPVGSRLDDGVMIAELDKDRLDAFRDKYRFWQDAD